MAYTTIDDPSAHFHTQLYTGDGNATQAITNDANAGDFQPDWLWLKRRTDAEHHMLADSTRGAGKRLRSDVNNAEDNNGVTSFNTDGFTTLSSAVWNASSKNYVAWQWKANGGTTSTNSSGSSNSTVQANTTAGFSIVKRTGTGSAGATYGHGLGAVPDVIINKGLNSNEWYSYFKAIGGGTHWIALESDGAKVDDANMWNDTDATSTVFTVGNSGGSNGSSVEYIAYCFTEIQGYSKFGTYTGNGNDDGTFVYLGFKPAFLLLKKTSATASWQIRDNKRDTYNENSSQILFADINDAEASSTNNIADFLSNGFKLRGTGGDHNEDGGTFVYMAFAEHPFVSSEGVPTTAR